MSYNFVIGLLLEGRHSVEQRYWKDIKQLQIQQRRRRKAKDLCPLNSRLYPGLRVAYIDEVEERDGDKVQKETSFVTIGQRVPANPLKVRFHYGHPDVFDRIFHITRGGISKASCDINLSEDIFAGFEWQKIVDDWDDWTKWISSRGGIGVPANKAWESWWEEEQEHLQSTGLLGRFWEIILSLRFFIFQYGIMYHLNISAGNKSISFFSQFCILQLATYSQASLHLHPQDGPFCRYRKQVNRWSRHLGCGDLSRLSEYLMGIVIFVPVAVLAWFPFVSEFQTRLLFNQAFSRGLQISRILAGGKKQG
ncbi:hypothetical protein E2562_016749 [Oryza meyeriana var. granulata]|uniref:Glycosyl transferase 48 domain-containing protein n=1 Tax=Oryza meyeriana var. granulata TaxID=110450 RepID=A0A6G1BL75_9ORYZ|nr:hypothetical protein E2562_016749 [Oryza meyeriana var. granulata]